MAVDPDASPTRPGKPAADTSGNQQGSSEQFEVDLNKPLVFQVGHLGDRYEEWVHQPVVTRESPRFFESDFCEFFSRTKWYIIPIVWLPIVTWFELSGLRAGLALPSVPLCMAAGIFLWSLMEYSMHRFLFHARTTSYWSNTLHYLLHGCHHKHPMDGLRLVFPPVLAGVFVLIFMSCYQLLLPPRFANAVFGGTILGYILYDVTHYYLHHGVPSAAYVKQLKTGSPTKSYSEVGITACTCRADSSKY
eukprot:jgi/Mesen1/8267/ME000448S07424